MPATAGFDRKGLMKAITQLLSRRKKKRMSYGIIKPLYP